jgi:N-acyl-D-amino-acid deacylase
VAKMSGQPAAKLRLSDRGLLRENYFADLALFDPAVVRDEATFADPHRYPVGIPYVIVNGQVAVDRGTFNEHQAGRILGRKSLH